MVQHYSAHPSESVAGIQLLLRVQAVSKSRRRRPRRRHVRRAVLVSSAATGYAGAAGEGQAPLYNVAAAAESPAVPPRCPPKTWQCITSASGAMNSVVFLVFWRCDLRVSSEHIRILKI